MGKGRAEPGTPKYIANKIKSKGLQKLRWFCQMCSKQCRDENGFKCHTMSESHQRQLLLFADNAGRYLSEFSYEFSKGFLFLLKRQFGTKRVKANKVYQEYISDRTHLHMNATQWTTLTGFVKWLGKTGIYLKKPIRTICSSFNVDHQYSKFAQLLNLNVLQNYLGTI